MTNMILVACEFSGRVRDALIGRGLKAISCDLMPSEAPGPHIQGDVLAQLGRPWDAVIAFPPCTYLSQAGARYWPGRRAEQEAAIEFVRALWSADAPCVALENPQGVLTTRFRPPDQVVSHHWFGAPYTKRTCLWLRGLPPLMATYVDANPRTFVQAHPHSGAGHAAQGAAWRRRTRLPLGFAEAMAEQWLPWLQQAASPFGLYQRRPLLKPPAMADSPLWTNRT